MWWSYREMDEIVIRIFRVDAAFDSVQIRKIIFTGDWNTCGDFNLLLDQVVVDHFFRDRMLYLNRVFISMK